MEQDLWGMEPVMSRVAGGGRRYEQGRQVIYLASTIVAKFPPAEGVTCVLSRPGWVWRASGRAVTPVCRGTRLSWAEIRGLGQAGHRLLRYRALLQNLNALLVIESLTEALAMYVCAFVRLCVERGWCPSWHIGIDFFLSFIISIFASINESKGWRHLAAEMA